MPRTIVALDILTGSYTKIVDDVSISGINVSVSGSLAVTGSAYFKNTTVNDYPITSTGISGSLTNLADGTSYLIAGSNTQISTGSNGAVTISSNATGGGSSAAIAYNGYCTGSLQWSSTTWADFRGVPGNFTDTLQNGITRSGSTFTVISGGTYYFRSDFVNSSLASYTSFRLSGSSGTIIQQTARASNTNPTDGDGSDLTGIFTLQAGASFKLQYAWKTAVLGGSAGTWSPSDPINGENMRTGAISIFRIGTS